jgi:hypothetical protein
MSENLVVKDMYGEIIIVRWCDEYLVGPFWFVDIFDDHGPYYSEGYDDPAYEGWKYNNDTKAGDVKWQ